MIYAFKIFIREMSLIIYAKIFGYYKSIDVIPIYNWFKLTEGEFAYLYKRRINMHPEYFKLVYNDMFFQLERIDTNYFEKIHKVAYLRAWYVLTKKPQYLNSSNFLMAEINKAKEVKRKPIKLNELVTYIEETFKNVGTIDVHKMSASRFFSLYYRAIDKNKPDANN